MLAAIAIALDDVHHSRTKHIDIKHHYIRGEVQKGVIVLKWVPTADQQADVLTKALCVPTHQRLAALVLGLPPPRDMKLSTGAISDEKMQVWRDRMGVFQAGG